MARRGGRRSDGFVHRMDALLLADHDDGAPGDLDPGGEHAGRAPRGAPAGRTTGGGSPVVGAPTAACRVGPGDIRRNGALALPGRQVGSAAWVRGQTTPSSRSEVSR